MCVCVHPPQTERDTSSSFKRTKTGLDSEFSFC